MPLTVETGSGLPLADAYVSIAGFKAHCDAMGHDYSPFTDAEIETRIRVAADYIDTSFRFKGTRLTEAQEREFPRDDLSDWSGMAVTGVPKRVVKANVELAFKGLTEALFTDLDRGGRVTSESVGPISVSYAPDAPAGKSFTVAVNLLKPYLREGTDVDRPPFFSTSESPSFGNGMFDNPDAATELE